MDTQAHSQTAARLFILYGSTAFCCTLLVLMLTSPPALLALAWLQILSFSTEFKMVIVELMAAEQVQLVLGLVTVGISSAWLSHRWTLRVLVRDYGLKAATSNSEVVVASNSQSHSANFNWASRSAAKSASRKIGKPTKEKREAQQEINHSTIGLFDSSNNLQSSKEKTSAGVSQPVKEKMISKPILQYLKAG